MKLNNNQTQIIRQKQLTEKIVIVDGQPGCGKTMLSPIIASMERVELLSYAFEIEFICRLFHLNKIQSDAAISMIRMLVDHKLYQTMMGRDTNFRFSDLSSVFQDAEPLRYFKRIFQKGDLDNMINSPNPTFKHPDPDAQKLKIPKEGGQEAPSIVKDLASKPTSGTHVVTTNK